MEEQIRCELTWQAWDQLLWMVAFADAGAFDGVLVRIPEFLERRRETVLGFSDQVPFWAKLAAGKQLYTAEEVKRRGGKNIKADDSQVWIYASMRME